jgi:hypothetical protein
MVFIIMADCGPWAEWPTLTDADELLLSPWQPFGRLKMHVSFALQDPWVQGSRHLMQHCLLATTMQFANVEQ